MTERALYDALLAGWFLLSAAVFLVLHRVRAPYGRHLRPGFGPTIPARAAWVLMEIPAVLTIAACFAAGPRRGGAAPLLLAMWESHYLYRALVYPFRARLGGRRMPLAIALLGAATNVAVGYLNGRWLFAFGPPRPLAWLASPPFLAGAALFFAGMAANRHSDAILRRLRAPGETGYRVPRGGLYRWVSCPNFLGEIVQWLGWAVATWSLAGLAFAVWSFANLAPRARAHHAWYRATFPDYPPERRALVPFLY